MKNKGALYVGLLLMTLGALFLVIQLSGLIGIGWRLWPLLVLFAGYCFWLPLLIWWPSRAKIAGFAVPATVLTVNGVIFLIQSLLGDFSSWRYVWALEPIAVALGLLGIYILGHRDRGLLIAAAIVGGVGLALFLVFTAAFSSVLRILLPVGLILVGILMFLRGSRDRAEERPGGAD